MMTRIFLVLLCSAGLFVDGGAQEVVAPLRANPALAAAPAAMPVRAKTTAVTLPFFEDFTDYSLYPNAGRWDDRQVYVNNTMALGAVSRGVATFDALNERGRPYDTTNAFAVRYADSLTSVEIDLTDVTPADSLYLSFFYQAQGAGFSPEAGDSLMLYFRTTGGIWRKMWSVAGSTLTPFRQVLVPVRDTIFFGAAFRFRFVNKASINLNDDVWNLDYIRLAAGRSAVDTMLNDPATTAQPTGLLQDYTAMPLRQYNAAPPAQYRATALLYTVRNNSTATLAQPDGYVSTVAGAGAVGSATGTVSASPQATVIRSFPNNVTVPASGPAPLVVQSRFYFGDVGGGNSRVNDTILHEQVFDNYLAYDDGTAERSYFLNLFPTLPGKVAIEHRLFTADTLRGLSILFGQQVPTASGKFFTIAIYRTLAGVNGGTADNVVYQQEFQQPAFTDTVNLPRVYPFALPVVMPAGTFYVGLIQPAVSGSDSLYYALDANRVGSNHAYFNVLDQWQSSGVAGALMVRPLLGGPLRLAVEDATVVAAPTFELYPNPGTSVLNIRGAQRIAYRVSNMQGQVLATGALVGDGQAVDTRGWPPGVYLVQVQHGAGWSAAQRWVKW